MAIASALFGLVARGQAAICQEIAPGDHLDAELLSIISHELRTPLNSITGFGSILEAGIGGELNAVQLGYVRRLMNSAEALLALVNDLLDVSAFQAGKLSLNVATVQLERIVEVVRDRLAPAADRQGIELRIEAVSERVAVQADGHRLEEVLMNLLGNAIKFTPAGGAVVVTVRRDGPVAECAVRDTGASIAADDVPKLFRRFGRLEGRPPARAERGSGLGLWIAKTLVEAHGGTIGVDSEPGHGASFWFRLPIAAGAGCAADPGSDL